MFSKMYRLKKVTQKARKLLRDYKLNRTTSGSIKGDLNDEEYGSALFMSVIMTGEVCNRLADIKTLFNKRGIKS